MKRKLFVSLCLIAVCIFTLASCGKVPEYKTEHKSGTYMVSTFSDLERLAFNKKVSPEDVAKIIPDFCIYEFYTGYEAYAIMDASKLCENNEIQEVE